MMIDNIIRYDNISIYYIYIHIQIYTLPIYQYTYLHISWGNSLTFLLKSEVTMARANAATSFLSERATVARARLMGGVGGLVVTSQTVGGQ